MQINVYGQFLRKTYTLNNFVLTKTSAGIALVNINKGIFYFIQFLFFWGGSMINNTIAPGPVANPWIS